MSSTPHSQMLDDSAAEYFRSVVYANYEQRGRDFPWRHTTDPYHTLVSEMMLQQTQTSRVANKFQEFVERFPNFESLSRASAADVLGAWQGLGYNRRAIALHSIAQTVCSTFDGHLPQEKAELLALPGVGPYTAAALRVFAFDLPEVLLETNIRTVYLHEFFPGTAAVRDSDILPLIEATVDRARPREWYQALMDYGAMLKETGNPSRRSAHHRPQSLFKGSRRQARGIILRTLLAEGPVPADQLASRIAGWDGRFAEALETLKRDGFVVEADSVLSIIA